MYIPLKDGKRTVIKNTITTKTRFGVGDRKDYYTIIDVLVYKGVIYALLESDRYGEDDMLVVKLPENIKHISKGNLWLCYIPKENIIVDTCNDIITTLEDEGIIGNGDDPCYLLTDGQLDYDDSIVQRYYRYYAEDHDCGGIVFAETREEAVKIVKRKYPKESNLLVWDPYVDEYFDPDNPSLLETSGS